MIVFAVSFEVVAADSPLGHSTAVPCTYNDFDGKETTTIEMTEAICMKQRVRSLQRQVKDRDKKINNLTANLTFLQPDQIRALQSLPGSRNKGVAWSIDTIKTAFQLRYSCGIKGYELLRKLGYPLPSYSTLCQKVDHAKFVPGIQHDVIEWFNVKSSTMKIQEKDCTLMIDEMQIKKCVEYDRGLKRYLGYVSSELSWTSGAAELADHALVFMIRGMSTNWKQTVAYFFSGRSIQGSALWSIASEIVCILGRIGIFVRAIVSDMGSSNQAMWRAAGIHAGRNSVSCYSNHPFLEGQKMYFLADIPHLLKNIRNCLLTQDIVLPPDVLIKEHLISPKVSIQHIAAVINHEEDNELKIAPVLSRHHVEPGQYQKMRVSTAAQLLSHSTASVLRFCVQNGTLENDALTTAWFVDFINKWFDVVNARHYQFAMTPLSTDSVQVLHEMVDLASKVMFLGKRCSWKPIQAGCYSQHII